MFLLTAFKSRKQKTNPWYFIIRGCLCLGGRNSHHLSLDSNLPEITQLMRKFLLSDVVILYNQLDKSKPWSYLSLPIKDIILKSIQPNLGAEAAYCKSLKNCRMSWLRFQHVAAWYLWWVSGRFCLHGWCFGLEAVWKYAYFVFRRPSVHQQAE